MFKAALLADLRGKQRYSQRTLAVAAGVKSSWIASLEAGGINNPGHLELAKIARILGVDPDVFFDELAEGTTQAPTQAAS